MSTHPNHPQRWDAQATAWSNQSHGHLPPQPPKRRGAGNGVAVAIVTAVAIAFIGLPFALRLGLKRLAGASEVDKTDIPRLIEAHLPCKRHCEVSHIVLLKGAHVSVTVRSEDVEGRTLSYSVWHGGAELSGSMDLGSRDTHFDYRDIDWSVVSELEKDLNRKAASGRTVNTIMILPCDFKKRESRPCVDAKVLTPKGDFSRRVDASSGELVWEG